MDESWDADFDGELRVPDSVASSSTSVRSEVNAARQLAAVTARLRTLLLEGDIPSAQGEQLRRAAQLVQASTLDENDAFFKSEAFRRYGGDRQLDIGGSIEDVLRRAEAVERALRAR